MRDKTMSFTVPFEKAEAILDSPQQLIKITNDDGVWDGDSINKADIIGTYRDREAELDWSRKNVKGISEPIIDLTADPKIAELRSKISKMFQSEPTN